MFLLPKLNSEVVCLCNILDGSTEQVYLVVEHIARRYLFITYLLHYFACIWHESEAFSVLCVVPVIALG
jgi:hypothetical protein